MTPFGWWLGSGVIVYWVRLFSIHLDVLSCSVLATSPWFVLTASVCPVLLSVSSVVRLCLNLWVPLLRTSPAAKCVDVVYATPFRSRHTCPKELPPFTSLTLSHSITQGRTHTLTRQLIFIVSITHLFTQPLTLFFNYFFLTITYIIH